MKPDPTGFDTVAWDAGPGESASLPTKWMSAAGRTLHLVFSGNDSFSVRQVQFILSPQPNAKISTNR